MTFTKSFVAVRFFAAMCAMALAASCATTPVVTRDDTSAAGETLRGSVNSINYADIRSVANGVLQDIFFTNNVLSRSAKAAESEPFRVVIRSAYNNTQSDRITTDQFLRILKEELIKTGIVEIHTRDSADWEYAVDARLDSTTAQVGKTRQAIYNMTLTLSTIDNREIGVWSEELQLTGKY